MSDTTQDRPDLSELWWESRLCYAAMLYALVPAERRLVPVAIFTVVALVCAHLAYRDLRHD